MPTTALNRRLALFAALACSGIWWAQAQEEPAATSDAVPGNLAEEAAADRVRVQERERAIAKLKPHAAVTVFDFGAVGDGDIDDTAAIQRAVNAKRGAVRLPRGVFRITKPIEVPLDEVGFTSIVGDGTARVVMAGPGPAFRFVGTHTGSADPKSFKPNVWDRQRMPIVTGIEIVGDHEEANGIEATGVMQLTVDRVLVRHAKHAIHLTVRNRNVIISNCHLYENRGAGVFYDNVSLHQSNIIGSHISYNGGGGVVSIGGDVRNIHIGTCDLEANHSADGPPTANVLIDAAGTKYGTGEVAITGCTIQHTHNAPESANIRIFGKSGIEAGTLGREGNVTITGNVLSDVQTNIHLKDCRGVTLTGNTFWMAYSEDLLVENCSDIVAGLNNLDRNPRYDYGDTALAKNGVIFRDCADCTLSGMHIHGVERQQAGMLIRNCERFNITGCTILDCEGAGLWLDNVTDSRVSDCLVRDDRPAAKDAVALRVTGGSGNQLSDNLLGGRVMNDTTEK